MTPGWRISSGSSRAGIRVAVEFRHPSWHCEEIFALLEEHRAAYCVMSGAGLPCVLRATTDFVYLRLHGPDHHHLYAGSYPGTDLRWWADRIREWNLTGQDVLAYFNKRRQRLRGTERADPAGAARIRRCQLSRYISRQSGLTGVAARLSRTLSWGRSRHLTRADAGTRCQADVADAARPGLLCRGDHEVLAGPMTTCRLRPGCRARFTDSLRPPGRAAPGCRHRGRNRCCPAAPGSHSSVFSKRTIVPSRSFRGQLQVVDHRIDDLQAAAVLGNRGHRIAR